MKIALVSDTHGNFAALRAVIADINLHCPGIDIYDLGDLLDGGPRPADVLDIALSRYRGFIRGNHEDYQSLFLTQPAWEKRHHELWKLVPHGVRASGKKLWEFLNLQKSNIQLTPDITFLHASLTSNAKVPSFLPDQKTGTFLLPSKHLLCARHFYFMGHTHHPGIHKSPDGDIWINVGSVGYPFIGKDMTNGLGFNPRSTWLLLEIIDSRDQSWQSSFSGLTSSSINPLSETQFSSPQNSRKLTDIQKSSQASKDFLELPKLIVEFHMVAYDASELLDDWCESGALHDGTPFSIAILAQSLWNQDLTYSIFKSAKSYEPELLSKHFKSELKRLQVCEHLLDQKLHAKIERAIESIRKNL